MNIINNIIINMIKSFVSLCTYSLIIIGRMKYRLVHYLLESTPNELAVAPTTIANTQLNRF